MFRLIKFLPRLFKILPKLGSITKLVEEANKMEGGIKAGIKTTEFWGKMIVQVLSVVGALTGLIPEQYALLTVAVLEGIYNLMRGVVKAKGGQELPPLPGKPVA